MSITIANLIAQVGADISQFNIGMNEVEARMRLAEIRAGESENRVHMMRERAARAEESADIARQRRIELRREQGARSRAMPALQTAYTDAVNEAANASGRLHAAIAQRQAGLTVNVRAAANDLRRANRDVETTLGRLQANERAITNIAQRRATLGRGMAANLGRAAEDRRRAATYDIERIQAQEVARAYAMRLQQNAQEHRVRAYNAISAGAERAGVVLGGGLAIATKVGSDFNQMLVTTAHNTSLSASGIQTMNDTVKKLGQDSGAPMDKLADGFRAIENRGYSAADAIKVLTPAMEASVAKGSDLGATTTLLANVMKEFFIPVSRAADAMGMLVEISRRSGVTMEDMTHVFGQMTAMSGNFGVSLAETGAAFVVFTRHGLNAAQAATQFRNDIQKIIKPTNETKKAIADIFKETGVDLKKYFGTAGLRSYGFSGLFGAQGAIVDAAKKYKGGVNPTDITSKLFPSLRGLTGATIATGTGAQEWAGALKNIQDASTSGANVNKLYQESLNQVNQQFERLKNSAIVATGSITQTLAPDIKRLANNVTELTQKFSALEPWLQSGIVRLLAFSAGALVFAGVVGKLIVGIAALNTALITMGLTLGGVVAAAAPWVIAIAAIVAALGAAWYATEQANHSMERMDAQMNATIASNVQLSATNLANAHELSQLVGEYTRLHSVANKTTVQKDRLREVMNRISQLSPELVTGYDRQGNAINVIADAAQRASDNLRSMANAATMANATSQSAISSGIAEQRSLLQDKLDAAKWLLQNQRRILPGVTSTFGERQTPLGVEVPGNLAERILNQGRPSFAEPGTESYSRLTPANRAAEIMMRQTEIRNLIAQMAGLDRQRQAADAAIRRTFETAPVRHGQLVRPIVPGTTPGIDLRNIGAGPAGPDKMNDLDGKKAKKEKESEAERDARRLSDRYQALMEGFAQQKFLAIHEGKAGEMMWETMEHGELKLLGATVKLNGEFAKYPKHLRDALVEQAKQSDAMAAGTKWTEMYKNAQLALFEATKNADGTERTPSQIIQKKMELGGYKEYGAHATDAMFTDIKLAKQKEQNKLEAQLKKFRDEANKPLEKSLSVHDQMIKDIKDEAGLYEFIEAMQSGSVERLASMAQRNADIAESAKIYTDDMEKATEAHKKIGLQLAGDDTELSAKKLDLMSKSYQNLTGWQRIFELGVAKQADDDQKRLDIIKAQTAAAVSLDEALTQAEIDVIGAKDPATQRWLEFMQKQIEVYGDAWTKLSAKGKADAERNARSVFGKVESLKSYETLLHGISDTMDAVTKGTEEINDRMKIQAGDVRLATSQWDRLNETQKQAVRDYALLFDVNAQIQEGLQGLANLFGKTLNDIREHRFKTFFQDIIAGFDNMLYEMANKWSESQVMKLLTSTIGGLFGGGGGDTIQFDPGTAPSAIAGALASGGPVQQGMSYLVGENGPEIFKPGSSGRVVNNHDAFGGGTTINLYVNGVTDVNSFQASRHQIAATLGRVVAATGGR